MVMTFPALLQWMGGCAPPPGTLKPVLPGILCMSVRGQVSGAVVQGLGL